MFILSEYCSHLRFLLMVGLEIWCLAEMIGMYFDWHRRTCIFLLWTKRKNISTVILTAKIVWLPFLIFWLQCIGCLANQSYKFLVDASKQKLQEPFQLQLRLPSQLYQMLHHQFMPMMHILATQQVYLRHMKGARATSLYWSGKHSGRSIEFMLIGLMIPRLCTTCQVEWRPEFGFLLLKISISWKYRRLNSSPQTQDFENMCSLIVGDQFIGFFFPSCFLLKLL